MPKGAQAGNRLAKVGRAWEDILAVAIASIPGLYLGHFGPPCRVIGVGASKGGNRAPMVVFEGQAPLDFVGHYHGRHCEIDAKRMTGDGPSWSWGSSMAPDQVARCHALMVGGCLVGIALLHDGSGKCYGLPWRFVDTYRKARRMSIPLADIEAALPSGLVVNLRPGGGMVDLRIFLSLLSQQAEDCHG